MPSNITYTNAFSYEDAIKKMLKIGGLWVVRDGFTPEEKMLCHYDYVPHVPEGSKVFRLPSYDGQRISYSNYDMIRHMTKDELARFLGETKAYWCDFEDRTEEETKKFLEWLDEEAEDNA